MLENITELKSKSNITFKICQKLNFCVNRSEFKLKLK